MKLAIAGAGEHGIGMQCGVHAAQKAVADALAPDPRRPPKTGARPGQSPWLCASDGTN
jgi:hypothetical protein